MKPEKFQELLDAVEDFIAQHELRNPHYLRDEEIIEYFSCYKKKHVKRAIEELR